jgi:Tfp pilus assembly protein PilE
MKRHCRRLRSGQAGDTLVELLVTMIIALIVFVALVPLFVGAQGKNSADLFRQTALNTAQDRIEKIRALDYGSITTTNLNNSSFVSGTFGPTATIGTGGALRTFNVVYSVTDTTTYKVVSVTVTWTAPPAPVKPVVAQTVIYRQYAGPTLASFYVTPSVNDSGLIGNASLTTVKLSALPTTQWLGGNTASVQFTVFDGGGTTVDSETASYTTDGSPGYGTTHGVTSDTFWWNWDTTGAADGTYSVSATGFSGSYFGPTERFYFKIQRGNSLAAPQNLTATAGQTSVTLTWSAVPNATKYNVYRRQSSGDPWVLTGTAVGQATTTYQDNGPLTPDTNYQYKVVGVDSASNEGLEATVTTKTTNSGVTLPSAPQNLVAAGDQPSAGVIELSWLQPATWGSQAQDYLIEMSPNGTSNWTTVNTMPYNSPPYPDSTQNYIYDYTAGSGVTLYFRVTARAVGGVAGGVSNVASASTAAATYKGPLTLTNTTNGNNKDVWVWVQSVSSGSYYDTFGNSYTAANKPAGVDVPSKSGTAVFASLPNGAYNVWVSGSSSYGGAGTSPQTSATINNAPAAANVHN